ncbi:MAG: hypothetical protein M5R36_11955 [Deltaproteobacteria bacterium]|nr:hypothetical protein [Deltaproteobacteria bacterium]
MTACSCGDPSTSSGQASDDDTDSGIHDDDTQADDPADGGDDDVSDDDTDDDVDDDLDDDSDDAADDDSQSDDDDTWVFDEDLARGCVELPAGVVDLGFDESAPPIRGCGVASFVTPDGAEICVVDGGDGGDEGFDTAVDSQGNVHVIATHGRDLHLFSLSAVKIAAGSVRPTDWNDEIIAFMAFDPRLVIGADDLFHIIYTDGWELEINYLFGRPGGPWTAETVESMSSFPDYDTENAIALGPDGTPHAVWHNWDDGGLHYGHRADGVWETALLFGPDDIDEEAGFLNAIDVALDGSVHIVTLAGLGDFSNYFWVYYGTNAGGDFAFEYVDGGAPWYPDVHAAADGQVFLSYWSGSWTKIAHKPSPLARQWTIDKVLFTLDPIVSSFLFEDADMVPSVYFEAGTFPWPTLQRWKRDDAWWAKTTLLTFDDWVNPAVNACANDAFSMAYQTESTWSSLNWVFNQGARKVSSRISNGHVQDAAMAVSDDGAFHAVYTREMPDNTRTLLYLSNASGSWSSEVLETSSGQSPSIAVDSQGRVHVSQLKQGDVVYLLRESGTWTTETVRAGSYLTKIDVLSDDSPIIYHDASEGVTLTVKEGHSWISEVVATGTYATGEVVVGADDLIHLCYYSMPLDTFYYAQGSTGDWNEEAIIAGLPGVIAYAAMDLDSTGVAYVAVYAEQNRKLYYLTNRTGTWTTGRSDPRCR